MGSFDAKFLSLPPEVIITSIRSHQKCFALARSGWRAHPIIIFSSSNIDRQGWRQGDRRRQRQGHRGAACRREVLLGPGPQDAASGAACPSSTTSPSTPSSARRASGCAGSRRWRPDRRDHRCRRRCGAAGGAARQGRSRHRHGRRVPRTAGHDGQLLCARARTSTDAVADGDPRPLQAARSERHRAGGAGHPGRGDSPTSSIRWSASSPSTKSRPGRRTRSRCAGRRSASSGWCSTTSSGCACCRCSSCYRKRHLPTLPRGAFGQFRCGHPPRFLRRPAQGPSAQQGARHDLIDAVFALGGQDDLVDRA